MPLGRRVAGRWPSALRIQQAQESKARDRLFATLAFQTRYFRDLGRLALRSKKARADFDRVQLPVAKKGPKKPPTPAGEGK